MQLESSSNVAGRFALQLSLDGSAGAQLVGSRNATLLTAHSELVIFGTHSVYYKSQLTKAL